MVKAQAWLSASSKRLKPGNAISDLSGKISATTRPTASIAPAPTSAAMPGLAMPGRRA